MKYQGEEEEHMKAASNHLSYQHRNNAMGHNSEYQHNCKPFLEASILDIQQHSTKRKFSEAVHIHEQIYIRLHDKSELECIVKYITYIV